MESFTADVMENISSALLVMSPSAVRPRQKGWFVHHNFSGKYLECEGFVSFVSFAQKVNLPQWFQQLGIAIGVK